MGRLLRWAPEFRGSSPSVGDDSRQGATYAAPMSFPSSLRSGVVARRTRRLIRRTARRIPGRAAVLEYHRVACPKVDPWKLAVSPTNFESQLAVLRDLGEIRRLDELLDESMATRLRRRETQFAITFDDGYVDNLEWGLPLLEAFEAPATVFIAPGLIGRPSFWSDVLADLVLGSDLTVAQVLDAARQCNIVDSDEAATWEQLDLRSSHELLYGRLVLRQVDAIESDLRDLADELGVELPTPGGRPMTARELATFASHPLVDIGVHTMTHPRLDKLPIGAVRAEIHDAARQLNDLFGAQPRVLAYPYGASSDAVVDVARSLGFVHAVTTESTWLSRCGDGLTAPRLHAPDIDGSSFDEWLRLWA